MSKVHFIAIEGVDFSGKTTLVNSLKNYYEGRGKKIKTFRQPGSTAVGNQLRETIMSTDMDQKTMIILFWASRIGFYAKEIKPLLEDGLDDTYIVITDRWFYSTIAYNVNGSPELEDFYFGNLLDLEYKPQSCIYLDVSLPVIKQRSLLRSTDVNHFDTASEEVYQSRISVYKSLAFDYGAMYPIHADNEPEKVLKDAIQHIDTLI